MHKLSLFSQIRQLPQRHVRQGKLLYYFGSRNDYNIYVVMSGVMVELDVDESYKPGTEAKVGSLIGDIEVMAESPIRLQSWKAMTDTTLAIMDYREVESLGALYPELYLALLKGAIDALHAAEQELLKISNKSPQR